MLDKIKLYLHYMRVNIAAEVEYRYSFALGILSTLIENLAGVFLIWVLFTQVQTINGWTFAELLLLGSVATLSFSGWAVLCGGVHTLERRIRNGAFDKLLVRPLNSLFQISADHLDSDDIGSLLGGFAKLGIAMVLLGIHPSLFDIALFIVMVVSGIVILLSLVTIAASVAFWTTKSNAMVWMTMRMMAFSEYPLEIFNTGLVFILTFVLPFGFMSYYPAEVFITKGMYREYMILGPVMAAVFFAIAYGVWKLGIRNYASTGS